MTIQNATTYCCHAPTRLKVILAKTRAKPRFDLNLFYKCCAQLRGAIWLEKLQLGRKKLEPIRSKAFEGWGKFSTRTYFISKTTISIEIVSRRFQPRKEGKSYFRSGSSGETETWRGWQKKKQLTLADAFQNFRTAKTNKNEMKWHDGVFRISTAAENALVSHLFTFFRTILTQHMLLPISSLLTSKAVWMGRVMKNFFINGCGLEWQCLAVIGPD